MKFPTNTAIIHLMLGAIVGSFSLPILHYEDWTFYRQLLVVGTGFLISYLLLTLLINSIGRIIK